MINPMAAIKSDSNQPIPEDDLMITQWTGVRNRLDHLDTQVHELDQKVTAILSFIEEHRPALARGLSLMDPGAKLRSAMGMKPKDAKRG